MKSKYTNWDMILDNLEVSGLTHKEFCRIFNLSPNALDAHLFYERKKKRRRETGQNQLHGPGFLKVVIAREEV